MRKYIYVGLFFLFFASRALAQFTLVSGTVTDTNSVPYACGTITASLINNNGISPTLNGVTFTTVTSPVKLGCPTDPTTSRTAGFFQMQLADNTQIKCGIATCGIQTQWLFTVNIAGSPPPIGTGPQVCTAQLTISGVSQVITLASCAALALSNVATVPGGLNGQIQFNSNGVFGGSSFLGFLPSSGNLFYTLQSNTDGLQIKATGNTPAYAFRILDGASNAALTVSFPSAGAAARIALGPGFNNQVHLENNPANNDIAGVLTCAAGTVSKTFAAAFSSTPTIIVADETTSGGARVSAKSASAFTVTCTGATDVLDYFVIGNPN